MQANIHQNCVNLFYASEKVLNFLHESGYKQAKVSDSQLYIIGVDNIDPDQLLALLDLYGYEYTLQDFR